MRAALRMALLAPPILFWAAVFAALAGARLQDFACFAPAREIQAHAQAQRR